MNRNRRVVTSDPAVLQAGDEIICQPDGAIQTCIQQG